MKRDYQKRPATAARWWALAFLIFMVIGCAGPARQTVPEGAIPQTQAKRGDLQTRLMAQMASATLTGYQDYAVGPEDLLEILFYGQDDLNRETES